MIKDNSEPPVSCTGQRVRCPCDEHKVWRNWDGRRRYLKNRKARLAKRKITNEGRKDEIAEYLRNYRQANKETLSEKAKQFREENAEQISAQHKGFREANKERIAATQKEYYEANAERLKEYQKFHRDNIRHPLYKTWDSMKERCYNSNHPKYKNWGGRGISVCERWLSSFGNFIEDMGPKPTPSHSLDRYPNNNGNYEPGNCRWAIQQEQVNNTRKQMSYKLSIPEDSPIDYQDKLMTLREFSDLTKLPLIICKYRFAQHPDSIEWILHNDYDNRYYGLDGFKYNLTELSLISGVKYTTLNARLRQYGWTVKQAMELERRG